MRRIKHTVFLILALLPLAAYLFAVFRSGTVPGFLTTVETAFGDFGGFFEPLITPLLSELVELTGYDGSSGLCLDYRVLRRSDTRVSGVFALYVPDYHFHG